MAGVRKRLGSLMGPPGYHATGAVEDIATLASYTKAEAGQNAFRDAFYSVASIEASKAVSRDPGVITAAAARAVQDAGLAGVKNGKNLINPEEIVHGHYVNAYGRLTAHPDFQVTGFIRVRQGVTYTASHARGLALYDDALEFIPGTYESMDDEPYTFTPAQDSYFRVTAREAHLIAWQVEVGDTPTAYEPYRVILNPVGIPSDYIEPLQGEQRFNRNGHDLSAFTSLGNSSLEIRATLDSRDLGIFDWRSVFLGADAISGPTDDVAPVVTQQGTIGGNHGFGNTAYWAADTHDKTDADLGSIWTDGVREYALVQIRDDGTLLAARKYEIEADGTANAKRSVPTQLEHVSGATNTGALGQAAGWTQMHPAIQHIRQKVSVDGVELTDGEMTGVEMRVQESYDILDYASLYDQMTANIGVPYTDLNIASAMRLESDWRIRPHGKIVGEFHLTELQPTRLERWSGLHAAQSKGVTTRWLPGVKPINGLDWSAGVPPSNLTESQYVTQDDLHNPLQPPAVLIDVAPDFAVAIGVDPWYESGRGANRISERPDNLWFIHTTQKIYPRVAGNHAPGWGRVSIRGTRQYLTLEEADKALAVPTDTLMAWSSLKILADI